MENENDIYWIWLTNLFQIGPVTVNRLLELYGDPKRLYEVSQSSCFACDVLNKTQLSSLQAGRSLDNAKEIQEACAKNQISILPINSADYPTKAKIQKDAPPLLYVKGKLKPLNQSVGIVGARRCTQADKWKTAEITEDFVNKGYTIISGMAKGVDSYAHTTCLNKGGYTIAVLGNGLDICYPVEHQRLMQEIAERGTLISEYPLGSRPSTYTFPRRNRMIAAWADSLVVIGAGRGSGALITAKIGADLNKMVDYH